MKRTISITVEAESYVEDGETINDADEFVEAVENGWLNAFFENMKVVKVSSS